MTRLFFRVAHRPGPDRWYGRSVERAALAAKLDKLLAMRGDPVKGLPATVWAEALRRASRESSSFAPSSRSFARSSCPSGPIAARTTGARRRRSRRSKHGSRSPPRPRRSSQCKAAAKACTAARGETFGDQHRVPEAARALAWAVGPKEAAPIFDALACERRGAARAHRADAEYHLGPQQRRNIVDALRRVLLPPEAPVEEAVVSKAPVGAGPLLGRRSLRARPARHPQEVRRRVGHERGRDLDRGRARRRHARSASRTSRSAPRYALRDPRDRARATLHDRVVRALDRHEARPALPP